MSTQNKKQTRLLEQIAELEKEHKYALTNCDLYDALHDRVWHNRAEGIGEQLVYKKSLLFLGVY